MDWRDIPSLSALRAFEAAARCGSYSGAARELNVTHAAVAQHVRSLEAQLGQPLMERQGRGVTTVGGGRQLARDLAAGFAEIAAGIRAVRQTREGGPLSITTTQSFAENWLMPRIAQFWSAHPEVAITVSVDSQVIDLRRSEHHLGIRYGRGDWPGFEVEFLTNAQSLVVGTPELVARLPKDLDLDSEAGREAVAALPWVMDIEYAEFFPWLEARGLHPDRLNRTDFSSPPLVLAACRAGAGLSAQSLAIVEKDIAEGRLVTVPFTYDDDDLGYYMVHAPGVMPEALKLFIRWLKSVRSD